MNTNTTVDIDTTTDELVEVQPLATDATDEQKAEYYAKMESNSKQMYARMKKAEGFVQVDGKWVKPNKTTTTETTTTTQQPAQLSQADLITLIKADIADEDIKEVTDYATLRNISIADALKSSVVIGILKEKAEHRATAEGTHTGTTTRSTGTVSEDKLIEEANKGNMPEGDTDIARLVEARRDAKKKR